MNKLFPGIALAVSFAISAGLAWPQAPTVESLLARLDSAAAGFKTAKAGMKRTSYIASIKQDIVEDGSIVVKNAGGGKMEFRIDISGDNANGYAFRSNTAEHYLPALNEVDVFDAKKYRDLAQKLMVLGFGMSGKELTANYAISNSRRDVVNGQAGTAVDLAPKDKALIDKVHLRKAELWIADADNAPLKLKLYFGGGDTWTVEYSNRQLNPKLASDALEFPKGAKRVPQK